MRGFPFDSQIIGQDENGMPIYDRASSADEFARMLSDFFKNGVFGEDMCVVLADSAMKATVGVGEVFIQGRYGFITAPETIQFDPSESKPRIDTVVVRLDLTSAVNSIVTGVVKGTATDNPTAPVLTRDGTIWELGLADVLIPAGSTEIAQTNISDTRLSSSRCGIVEAVRSNANTDSLFKEFELLLENMRASLQEMYKGIEKVNIYDFGTFLSANGWPESEPYTKTISTPELLDTDEPFVDVNMAYATTVDEMRQLRDAFLCLLKVEVRAGKMTFTFSQKPAVDLDLKIKVVR